MPPYQAVTSKSQSRKLFALAQRGELKGGMDEAKGKTRAADFKSLPQHVRGAKRGKRPKMAPRTARR
jgi:hypothetical protein